MATVTEGASSVLTGSQLHLPQFEGPLDVLLRLIERSQLAITDLSLVRVTGQFLDHVRALDGQAPPQVIAEFTAVGARLTLLKSRSLLPRPPVEEIEEDPGDLTRQLEEYRQFKEIASGLSARLAEGTGCFGPDAARVAWSDPQPARLAHYEPAILIRSIRRRLSTIPRPATLLKQRPIVTLPQMVERIVSFLHLDGRVPFRTVLATCHDRSEAATAFLAMLVLHRRHMLHATQDELFGEIRIARRENLDASEDIGNAGAEAARAFAVTAADHDAVLVGADN
jgi:segregation and condensation protein A